MCVGVLFLGLFVLPVVINTHLNDPVLRLYGVSIPFGEVLFPFFYGFDA